MCLLHGHIKHYDSMQHYRRQYVYNHQFFQYQINFPYC